MNLTCKYCDVPIVENRRSNMGPQISELGYWYCSWICFSQSAENTWRTIRLRAAKFWREA